MHTLKVFIYRSWGSSMWRSGPAQFARGGWPTERPKGSSNASVTLFLHILWWYVHSWLMKPCGFYYSTSSSYFDIAICDYIRRSIIMLCIYSSLSSLGVFYQNTSKAMYTVSIQLVIIRVISLGWRVISLGGKGHIPGHKGVGSDKKTFNF